MAERRCREPPRPITILLINICTRWLTEPACREQANDTSQLAGAFSHIAEELRRQYTLGYYPKGANIADGEERQIRVRVRQQISR